jgi:hypothetical protein
MDIEKLKALALAASPGPWQWWTSNSMLRLTGADGRDGDVLHGYVHAGVGDVSCSEPNRAFIEASNPAAVLELIAEVERLRAALPTKPGTGVLSELRAMALCASEDMKDKALNMAIHALENIAAVEASAVPAAGTAEIYAVQPIETAPQSKWVLFWWVGAPNKITAPATWVKGQLNEELGVWVGERYLPTELFTHWREMPPGPTESHAKATNDTEAGTEKDTERLDFMITEECQIEHIDRIGAQPLYRVRWPWLEESQREWSVSGREAIDFAMKAKKDNT